MSTTDPKVVTVWGRLSFPAFTAEEAFQRNLKGTYPTKDVASTSPDFQLLLNATQLEKFVKHATDHFLPYCLEQNKKGETRDNLDAKEVKALLEGIAGDLGDQMYNSPLKALSEKSAVLAPEAVATLKCIGQKGGDIELKAIVNSEAELSVPDPDLLSFPAILPINRTVHQMYPGCNVAVTLNLYAYHNGKHPGFSAGASVAVFKSDNDRFGGGATIDEAEMFLDD
jgi:hypothetical protein